MSVVEVICGEHDNDIFVKPSHEKCVCPLLSGPLKEKSPGRIISELLLEKCHWGLLPKCYQ